MSKPKSLLLVAFFVAPAIGMFLGVLAAKFYVVLFENTKASMNSFGLFDLIFFIFAYPIMLVVMAIIGIPLHGILRSIPHTDNIITYCIIGFFQVGVLHLYFLQYWAKSSVS